MNAEKIEGIVFSGTGFYIGDLCYMLSAEDYDAYWGENNYADGIYEYGFAVASTAYGDGEYVDDHGHFYPVDAGNIALASAEIVKRRDRLDLVTYIEGEGYASFKAESGIFEIELPNGLTINIDTRYEDDEDE